MNLKHFIRNCIPDSIYLKYLFRKHIGQKLDLKNPKTFNQKLQWLKLNDRNPLYTKLVDKYESKKIVAQLIGQEHIIPTLGVWEKFEDIDFSNLPDSFVLKTTHDSGSVCICKDKRNFDYEYAKNKINSSLKNNFYYISREWPYKNVPPRIIAESYMEDSLTDELIDYKFYCFNGTPTFCQVITNRNTDERIDFFDMEWKHQDFTGLALPAHPFSNSPIPIPIPLKFDCMKEIAGKLSKGFQFLRVDLYCINNKVFFGELTFFPASGIGEFSPPEYNKIIGDMLHLEIK